ncbi:MAG: LuxR C-terminal-related transcriptional regulator [Marmoricola sp.]
MIIANEHGVRLIQSLVPRADLLAVAAQAGIELPSNVNHADPLASLRAPAQLTEREQVLLEHLATGALLREIADAEFVTLSTIKSQAASLYRKLGVNSRQAAINVAWQHGMID